MFVCDKLSDSPPSPARLKKDSPPPLPLHHRHCAIGSQLCLQTCISCACRKPEECHLLKSFIISFRTFFFYIPIFQKTYTIEYLVFPGTEQRFSALKHSAAILQPKLLVRSRVPSLFLCLRTKSLIIHPLKHLAFWGAFFSFIAFFWNSEINLHFCVFLLQVQSTSWMPHQQYVMQPTVSASPVLPAVAALGRPISRRVCLCVLLSALRLARRV